MDYIGPGYILLGFIMTFGPIIFVARLANHFLVKGPGRIFRI